MKKKYIYELIKCAGENRALIDFLRPKIHTYYLANVFTPLFILVEICRSMGRLASGIPQVPIRSGVKPMMSSSPEPILASLRSPQPVMLLKCGPDPRSR